MTESDLPVVQLTPGRWGDPAHPVELPAAAADALKHLGVRRPAAEPVEPTDRPGLTADQLSFLSQVVGNEHVVSDLESRWAHTRGYSTTDLLRFRAGDTSDMPDAVVYPGSHDEVQELLAGCADHDLAVVPYSGGTSVVGGLAAARRFVTVDLRRLDRLVELDEVSRTATLQAGVRGPAAEALLSDHGYTLGHFPQSYEGASIGGYAAARSSGQSSAGYGRFDQMVVGLTLATPRGTIELGRAPMSAAGPDLRQLVLGSEGAFGIITSVVVRIRPRPTERHFEGWRFESFDIGLAAVRRLAQDGPLPTVLRLSDEVETAVNLADPDVLGGSSGGVLAIVGFDGPYNQATAAVLTAAGGTNLGADPGETWRVGRYRAPYLRDPLLDQGALVETLETAAFWSRIPALKAAVTEALVGALGGTPPLVLCHISHVYETGASLYFTVICAQSDDPIEQWRTAKRAASQAIADAGGTISHHHGVGTDHRDAYATEIGPLAIETLRAVKNTLDPGNVMNPGVLLPESGA
ncbi:alkyldihydroxyacetonephosphate synthase [Kribbella sp. VKM Ac-2571]|uniref:FAD-binding oxidoreductase n=1 Tax=Kribbella sp. VKM Ac-2571 TaxID=2512222 RepID=UPI00105D0A9B|nr:FAD-binding oxidoreductase [Kribbella sp. VKM Ac-2571]TDO67312.1 alkyldihydroxyacetonephosphate synthase [Kribbella sp. VKM Ac-2571]